MRTCSAICIFLGLAVASTPLSAKCFRSEVVRVLDDYGYNYSELENDGDYNFLVSKDGKRIRLWVETDGDLSLRKYYRNDDLYNNDEMAKTMLELKYLAIYLDNDKDIVMAYDYPSWGSCPNDLRNVINLFFDLTDAAAKKLATLR